MGGKVGLKSTPGQGSTFWFTAEAGIPKSAPATLSPSAGAAKSTQWRVLVVDDNNTNQFLLKEILTRIGHHVEIARDGVEAVGAMKERAFDLVLMDVNMPRMDGVTATRRIRAIPGKAARTPIVALTANAMHGDRETYLACGMTDYIAKPFDPTTLLAVITRVMSGSQEPA